MPDRITPAFADARAVYVTAGRLAAAQWRAYLVREALWRGERAVLGAEVLPYRAFAAELWEAGRRPGDPLLLSSRQSLALWRRIVAESPAGDRLLGAAGPARWAEAAWQASVAYGIDLDAAARRARGTDFAVFLSWARAYRARLTDAGWIDGALLDGALRGGAYAAARPVVVADLEPSPAQRAALERLERTGTRIGTAAPPEVRGRAAACRSADPGDELAAAAEWAAGKLRADPSACIAIVLPDLGERAAETRRVLQDALGANGEDVAERIFVAGERTTADTRPLLGAVLIGLELLLPSAGIAELSRWLRSPFFHDEPTLSAAAAFERSLRTLPGAQLPFVDAYRYAGLRPRMRAAVPSAAARIDAALERLGDPRPRSPGEWAALWPRVLDALGGPAWHAGGTSASAEQAAYEDALVELARLTPIVGSLTAADALAELEAGMTREPPAALPLAGVHVLADIGDVGPGYAGVWVTGATDAALPRPVELRPFLPPELQIAAGIPWSSPRDALERSRALLERVLARVPEVVYSWPEHVRDEPSEPSPLIRTLPPVERPARATAPRVRSWARRRETVPDPAPPLSGRTLPGGTAALELQSTCPLRAFCEHRLRARPLVPFARGVAPPERGRILHGALERFFRRYRSREALEDTPASELLRAIRRDAEAAAARIVGRGHVLLDVLAEIEAARAADALATLVARERERAPFRVESLELDATLEIRGFALRLRIDRIDALDSGGLAVIDYKTGAAPRAPDWLAPRLRDVQLPVYATAVPADRLAALVVAIVRSDRAAYSGLWDPADAFPGRGRAIADVPLAELVDTWREQIGALVDEYAKGDARLFVDGADAAAEGGYAPLTRVHELLDRAAAGLTEPQ